MARSRRARFLAAALAAGAHGLLLAEAPAQAQAFRRGESPPAPTGSQTRAGRGSLQLKVHRTPDAVELVIEGTGPAPQLQQAESASGWQGQLFTAGPSGLRSGPQRISLPEAGFQSITLDGSGSVYNLSVTPSPGINLGRPVVSADGQNLIVTFSSPVPQARLQTNRINLAQPGAVPLPTYAPPLQPRAVAPPLGDMAVGTMVMRSPGLLNLSGPPVTMTLRNAPAKDALMALAQLGGYGFAYVEDRDVNRDGNPDNQATITDFSPGSRPISISFQNESYSTAINTTLLSAGLQGRREGNVIFAGPRALGVGIGPQVSKIYRLNQVSPDEASRYLASLGATIVRTRVDIQTTSVGISSAAAVLGGQATQTTSTTRQELVEEFGANQGPLQGLRAATDPRLGTITMVGSADVVGIGEQYLRRLDLRQRQVALRVQILDVNLDNVSEIDNSFAFRFGDNFIVNNSGQLLGAFGRNLPPREDAFGRFQPESIEFDGEQFTTEGGPPNQGLVVNSRRNDASSGLRIDTTSNRNLSANTIQQIQRETRTRLIPELDPVTGVTRFIVDINPEFTSRTSLNGLARTIQNIVGDDARVVRFTDQSSVGLSGGIDLGSVPRNPGQNFQEDTFYNFLRAQIVSGSTKLLASPTLILQENASLLRGSLRRLLKKQSSRGRMAQRH